MSPRKRPPNEPDPSSEQPPRREPLRSRKAFAKRVEPKPADEAQKAATTRNSTPAIKKTKAPSRKGTEKAAGTAPSESGPDEPPIGADAPDPRRRTPTPKAPGAARKARTNRRATEEVSAGEPAPVRERTVRRRVPTPTAPPTVTPDAPRVRVSNPSGDQHPLAQFDLPSPNDPAAGVPRGFTRFQWLAKGFTRQGPATIVALLAGWTGFVVALWAAAIGAILGALIAVGLISTTSFTRSLFHSGAGEALTFVGVTAGALAGAGGSFTAIYATSSFGNPTRLAVTLTSGLVAATAVVVVITFAEPTLLRMRGYRRLSRDETRRIAPLVHQAATGLGLRTLPTFAMADVAAPQAWTHTRTIVLSKGLLDLLDDGELRAVLAHELWHWAVGDAVGLRLVWACAFPIAVAYNVGVWLSGRDLNSDEPQQRLPRGWIGWIGWFLLWPTWLLANAVIAPLVASRQRNHEYAADQAAVKIGDGASLSDALLKISAFEAGRTGWEFAMTRHHPPTELRKERLQVTQAGDDEYQQEELGGLPSGLLEKVALGVVAMLIVLGAMINHNRANLRALSRPITSGLSNPVPVAGDPGPLSPPPTPAPSQTLPPTMTVTTLPHVPSATAGFPHSRTGAINAAGSFTTALTKAVLDRPVYAALIRASGGPAEPDALVQEVDTSWQQHASDLAGQSVSTAASGVGVTLTEYDLDPAGDRAFVDVASTLTYTVEGSTLTTHISGKLLLTWFNPDGWKVTDITSFVAVG